MKNHIHFTYFVSLLCILLSCNSYSQDTLDFISNPSFEDKPRKGGYYSTVVETQRNEIKGWYDCGKSNFEFETAPDIHGNNNKFWSLDMMPSEGNTFLGMVTRDNDSWEEVSQELLHPMEKGNCYTFTIDLAKADPYISGSRLYMDDKPNYNYITPANLRIWAAFDTCERYDILYVSPPIDNEEWQTYEVVIQPKSDIKYITLQAYFVDDSKPYNGNIIVDNISKFIVSECEEK